MPWSPPTRCTFAAFLIQPDGDIMGVGGAGMPALTRIFSDGIVDLSSGHNGVSALPFHAPTGTLPPASRLPLPTARPWRPIATSCHYLDLAARGRVDLGGLLTHTFRLDAWRDAFTALAHQERSREM